MYLIIGRTGYVSAAFQQALLEEQEPFEVVGRGMLGGSDLPDFRRLLAEKRPRFVINCAGYVGHPNVDATEKNKLECLRVNTVLAAKVSESCMEAGVPLGHVSSGCIYHGTRADGGGFHESDPPNFAFRQNKGSFYGGTKALAEEMLSDNPQCYIWRLRYPFSHRDHPRNFLSKLTLYPKLVDLRNSISRLEEFVGAALACFRRQIPFGIYNLTNPGSISTREVVAMMREHGIIRREVTFFSSEEEFLELTGANRRATCVLDTSKLEKQGIRMTPIKESIEEALRNWIPMEPEAKAAPALAAAHG